jgi:putative Holliday junction resolvase
VRWLAVDFGERRVGVAISDPEGALALPLATLSRRSDEQVVGELARIANEEEVGRIVVGEPLRADGTAGDAARRVRRFADRLRAATGAPVELVGEALTSREAERRLREQGVDPRRHPARVDQLAAQLILEEALERARRAARAARRDGAGEAARAVEDATPPAARRGG